MKNERVKSCLTEQQAVLGHSLDLAAYLLKPVQRVLKYHLFMEVSSKSLLARNRNNFMCCFLELYWASN